MTTYLYGTCKACHKTTVIDQYSRCYRCFSSNKKEYQITKNQEIIAFIIAIMLILLLSKGLLVLIGIEQ